MIEKNKILAEVERLKHYGPIPYDRDMFEGVCLIESIINSLPPDSEISDVEEEINDYFEKHLEICNDNTLKCGGKEFSTYDLLNVIEYFTQWQRNQTINKACEWLQKHMNDYVHGRDINYLYDDFRKAMEKKNEQLNNKVNVEPPSFEESQGEFNSYNVALNG